MRILHVVTLVSPDGAFGGPVRVAENLARELVSRGHDVTVLAASRGFGEEPVPTELGGARLLAFPARRVAPGRFTGLTAPGMRRWIRQHADGFDVAHVHLGRDLVTLPAGSTVQRLGLPYVVQPHGMVIESSNPLAGPLDLAMTRRVLTGAGAILHLTDEERSGLLAVGAPEPLLAPLPNGVPDVDDVPPLPERPEVLFLARLHERKRPAYFSRMARALLDEGVDASFVLVGPDEGEGDAVRTDVAAVGDASRLRYEGPLPPTRTLERLAQASLVVLPSIDEPIGMSVLEAMSVGRGVVVTDTCGLAPAIAATGSGVVVDDTQEGLDEAVRGLLARPADLVDLGGRAHRAAQEVYGMRAVVDRLEDAYRRALASGRRA